MRDAPLFARFVFLGLATFGLATQPVCAAELNMTSNLVDKSGPAPDMPAAESDQPQFAKVIDDLPLMPGLRLKQDDDVLFASPQAGRIAETEAIGPVDVDDVYRFYRKTLPQLGWAKLDARHFRREQDLLRIDAKAEDKQTRVLFSITPADK